jgi:prepilin-type N-terminal cleavage/methylation domain-containing protein
MNRKRTNGFTLIEMVMVLLVFSVLALLAVPRLGGVGERARIIAAQADLATLRDATEAYLADMEPVPGFVPVNPVAGEARYECLNLRAHNFFCPSNLQSRAELGKWPSENYEAPLWDNAAKRGWRGPYVRGRDTVKTTGAMTGKRPDAPPDEGKPGYVEPAHFPRKDRFPGPDERLTAKGQTFYERGFYTRDDIAPGSSPYGFAGEFALADPWGNPYVLQVPEMDAFPVRMRPTAELDRAFAGLRWKYARWVSAGPDGVLDTPRDLCAGRDAESVGRRGDDAVLFLNRADTFEELE